MSKRRPKNHRKLEPFEKVDLAVAEATALNDRKLPGKAMAGFAEIGDQPPMVLLSSGIIAAGALRRDERMARTGLRMLASHSVAVGTKLIGKGVIDRTRPDEALKKGNYKLEEGDSRDNDLRSMPSGHSAGVTAVALAAMQDYPRLVLPIAVGASAVMLAQLPSRNHFLSDVAVGAALGLISGVIAWWLIPPQDRLDRRREAEQPA